MRLGCFPITPLERYCIFAVCGLKIANLVFMFLSGGDVSFSRGRQNFPDDYDAFV